MVEERQNVKMESRGTYQSVFTILWDTEDFQRLTVESKVLFLCLRTSSLYNRAGIFIAYNDAMTARTGLTVKQVEKSLEELNDARWIVREGRLFWIRNGLRFDPTMRPKVDPKHQKSIERIISGLPKCNLVINYCKYYGLDRPFVESTEGLLGPSEGFGNGNGIGNGNGLGNGLGDKPPIPEHTEETEPIKICFKKFVEAYHEKLTMLPKCDEPSDVLPQFRNRWKEKKARQNFDWWLSYIDRIKRSQFLTGMKTEWRASMPWILGPKNMVKVLNGQYDDMGMSGIGKIKPGDFRVPEVFKKASP